MQDPKNLGDYLAGLGISDADDDTSAPNPLSPASRPSTSVLLPGAAPTTAAAPFVGEQLESYGDQPDPKTALEQFLWGVARRFDPGLSVRVTQDGDYLEGEITGENVGRLIGREGHVIEALDTLAYAAVAKYMPEGQHLRVRVDVGGYRGRHFQMLRQLADRVAESVASSGEPHNFQPMNPADRRIIHMALKDNPHVVTQSVGEGHSRRLVVKPAPAR
ncbi:protein jag [Deinococcus radiophilus]|uniref:KH domain-containing protein n=1 Tax=Deinococcus radiophilus TaxID=32062 RepID=A0A3S0KM46_9DEIO|nr:R3H domain-containing nucleic acid-binding protein [Deinococcus radiophilus]RTR29841.1 KH domain-containing protein [Deinococcus radiophilus]UFA49810.1 KH domain-containing protein [Deinococcus radiophilus]